jgi:hypothetical protein
VCYNKHIRIKDTERNNEMKVTITAGAFEGYTGTAEPVNMGTDQGFVVRVKLDDGQGVWGTVELPLDATKPVA